MMALLLAPAAAEAQGEVGAVGRLAPKGGIIELAGTPGAQVQEVLVKPNDVVRRGDPLLVLSSRELLKVENEIARLELEASEQRGKVQIALQQAVLAAAELELRNAEAAVSEYRELGANAISPAELTRRRNLATEARSKVAVESIRLRELEKETSFQHSRAALQLALSEAKLRGATVVAPSDGVILKIRRQIGETLGSDPVVLMADVSQMYVVCDVFEGDVRRIKEGMQASASAKSLAEPLRGVVDRVGRIIDTTRKLAEVIIRLDDAQAAERLIGMEVQVTIHTEGGR
ncbi:MAG TPA: HlyD family efflux transporter periplasmic adaptor subunit [Alphaproteobacteria bacterium]|nr:HlyD family efflux transporter periplasmic adaptor subunit [Alphaproteobacteria bacterium]